MEAESADVPSSTTNDYDHVMKDRGSKRDRNALEEITNVERERSTKLDVKKTNETVSSKETVKQLWSLVGDFQAVDLDNGFYCFKFSNEMDFNHVLLGGPWIIANHYLTVKRWTPCFRSEEATIDSVAAWVHFPGMPLEFYDGDILKKMGNILGQTLMIDKNTLVASRGRYARMCVEIDLTKPLIPRIYIGGRWQRVEYKGLGMLCFQCGKFGHAKEQCDVLQNDNTVLPNEKVDKQPKDTHFHNNDGTDSKYGPWMIATKRVRKPRQEVAPKQMAQTMTQGGNLPENNVGGSRFAVLTEDQENMEEVEFVPCSIESVQPKEKTKAKNKAVEATNAKPQDNNDLRIFESTRVVKEDEIICVIAEASHVETEANQVPSLQEMAALGNVNDLMIKDKPPDDNLVALNNDAWTLLKEKMRPRSVVDAGDMEVEDLGYVASRRCLRNIKEVKAMHKLHALIILEPRISSLKADKVCKRSDFPDFFRVEVNGFSGGIWLLWDAAMVDIEVVAHSSQLIHAIVRLNNNCKWLLTAIYGSPEVVERSMLWKSLILANEVHQLPWLVLGDFNQVLSADEKMSKRGVNLNHCSQMQNCFAHCNLRDLETVGLIFTWCNKREEANYTRVKLDRAVANQMWIDLFPEISSAVLPRTHSDHHPISVKCKMVAKDMSNGKQFRFENVWMTHEDFLDVVKASWNNGSVDLALETNKLASILTK
ncbi:hypothetical protein REPUB_Repub13aG0124000 [Reevesia pubescens]